MQQGQQPGRAPQITMAVFSGAKESRQPFTSVFELALDLRRLQHAGDVSLQPLERYFFLHKRTNVKLIEVY